MGKGRRPVPEHIKRLTGNPGKRTGNTEAPSFPASEPEMPTCLAPEAAAHWARMVGLLRNARILTAISRDKLARYCVAWADWERVVYLEAQLGIVASFPKGDDLRTLQHWRNVKAQSESVMIDFEREYGLTPAAATRVKAQPTGPSIVNFDEFLAKKPVVTVDVEAQ